MTSQINPRCSPNMGEALAAHLATSLASSLHLKWFILEEDSQAVILALQKPSISQNWRISSTIYNIIDSIPTDSFLLARKVNRSANLCVHSVTHWATTKFNFDSIPTYPPPIPSIPIVRVKILYTCLDLTLTLALNFTFV
jgi:hypothetical protein